METPFVYCGTEYTIAAVEAAQEKAELAANPTKWRCKSCGFINIHTASECKSYGQWK